MANYATAFAERGYVSATITYRLAGDELGRVGYEAAARAAQHDAQAAAPEHRSAAHLHRRHSAGALTALEAAVSREDPGRSGNPGFSSRVRGAISLSGGLIDPKGVEQGDSPMLLVHGDADATVPFGAPSRCAPRRSKRP